MHFKVTTTGLDRFGLCEVCERFTNEQWLASHMTPEQVASIVLDQFKQAVANDLEMLEIESIED